MKFKVKHKTEGWTGELVFGELLPRSYGSHHQMFQIVVDLYQDEYKSNGDYVEDPSVQELEELELLPTPKRKVKEKKK